VSFAYKTFKIKEKIKSEELHAAHTHTKSKEKEQRASPASGDLHLRLSVLRV
jgi:hypothetical protein